VRGREERRPAAAARRTIGRIIVVVECEMTIMTVADSSALNSFTRKLPHDAQKPRPPSLIFLNIFFLFRSTCNSANL
jgi:hypothetical protein